MRTTFAAASTVTTANMAVAKSLSCFFGATVLYSKVDE
jgi:hypothetical protein